MFPRQTTRLPSVSSFFLRAVYIRIYKQLAGTLINRLLHAEIGFLFLRLYTPLDSSTINAKRPLESKFYPGPNSIDRTVPCTANLQNFQSIRHTDGLRIALRHLLWCRIAALVGNSFPSMGV